MKATGIVRKIDQLGRFTIPREILRALEISFRDPVEIFVDSNRIVLQKYQPDTYTVDELREALNLAAQDAGKSPAHYLPIKGQEVSENGG